MNALSKSEVVRYCSQLSRVELFTLFAEASSPLVVTANEVKLNDEHNPTNNFIGRQATTKSELLNKFVNCSVGDKVTVYLTCIICIS